MTLIKEETLESAKLRYRLNQIYAEIEMLNSERKHILKRIAELRTKGLTGF